MATKYAGQNAMNKLMQLVKTALNNKADKTHATTSAADSSANPATASATIGSSAHFARRKIRTFGKSAVSRSASGAKTT